MTITTYYKRAATPAAAIRPMELNVVGPYSIWPRNRGFVNATAVKMGGAALAGATAAHTVLPR